ncbi:MAG: UDP-N-acetylmuramoyl-L-alanyl-D-glutamate--2,6-diaminopimelate ligase [Candidatus Omnitrophica bacterium]|nr:UDP-N-acetylmuramoyl-L-alanyl-D-glutamate--2,6-diaminopimelate ligase [Candidatus Omnitrophota bacterium]
MKKLTYRGVTVSGIALNSRAVKRGDLFIAIKGEKADGHAYVEDAVMRGAVACVVQADRWKRRGLAIDGAKLIRVGDTHCALSALSARFYGEPSKKMRVVGITGTNGKTTIAFLLDKILTDLGFSTGMLGTVIYKVGTSSIPADRTTPDALSLQKFLGRMADAKTDFAVMEVSSHALCQKRVGKVFFDQAVFTNLTPEHLDYHKTMRDYLRAKAMIFDQLKRGGTAIVNNDDPAVRSLKRSISRKVLTFGIKDGGDVAAKNIHSDINGSVFRAVFPDRECSIRTRLIGRHNISNILAALAVSYANGLDIGKVAESIRLFPGPPGRLEAVDRGQNFTVFVDYAHTKDALSKVLSALRPYARHSRLITVFGCGGDRDRSKRPRMGEVAVRLSDQVVITSDNPRSENPLAIIREIRKGIGKEYRNYSIIPDRKAAIHKALSNARNNDIVLIAGKGHEAVQIVGNKQYTFDDRNVARKILDSLAAGR